MKKDINSCNKNNKEKYKNRQFGRVFLNKFLIFSCNISNKHQDKIPNKRSKSCIKDKFKEIHTKNPCRKTDKLPYCRNKSSKKSCNYSMMRKIHFSLIIMIFRKKNILSVAMNKALYNRSTKIHPKQIIDTCSKKSSECPNKTSKEKIHLSCTCKISCRYHRYFTRERDKTWLKHHHHKNPNIPKISYQMHDSIYKIMKHTTFFTILNCKVVYEKNPKNPILFYFLLFFILQCFSIFFIRDFFYFLF